MLAKYLCLLALAVSASMVSAQDSGSTGGAGDSGAATKESSEKAATERKIDEASKNGWGVFIGYLQGGEITKQEFSGKLAELDDTPTLGGYWFVNYTPKVRFEVRLGLASADVTNIPKGSVKTQLLYIDAALIPHWTFGRTTIGVPVGLGWALANSKEPYSDTVPGHSIPVNFDAYSGGTYFVGVRSSWALKNHWGIVVDARLRRFHRLVNVQSVTLSSPTLTVGIERSF